MKLQYKILEKGRGHGSDYLTTPTHVQGAILQVSEGGTIFKSLFWLEKHEVQRGLETCCTVSGKLRLLSGPKP